MATDMSYTLLTTRERQVVDAIMDGYTTCAMLQEKFGLGERTIKNCLQRIYKKYGVHRTQWVTMVRLVYLRSKELRELTLDKRPAAEVCVAVANVDEARVETAVSKS